MRKFLTTGLFGAILGLAVGAPADAALVSRGFLDEALENYATTTALDLKANQSDFTDLSDKIGTLPSGDFPLFPGSESLFPTLKQPLTYPTSLAELITAIYGNSETVGLLGAIIAGFPFDTDGDGSPDKFLGLIPNFNLATENATKIGTLPEGITVQGMLEGWTDSDGYNFPGLYKLASDTFKFKNTFSNVSIGTLLDAGLEKYTNNIYTGPIYPLWKLSEGIDKIGTLPDGYATVGAALTAIKGIAEDAKATALAAIPDPKAEGSTGKFVLTVDIVGDNATYRWEKIDREGETTTTTE